MDLEAKILVVDDERFNLNLLVDILKPRYKTIVAKNGHQALERAVAEVPPDLILLDVMMPDMDGYEVCRRLKADPVTHDIPVIFITAMSEIGDETRGLEAGAIDYITKPISPAIVQARVKNHLELKKYRDRLEDLVKERTAQLEQRSLELEAASRAKSDFLANMSHELRTPMNGIVTAADLVLTYDLPAELTELHEIIKSSSLSLMELVERILDYARSGDDELKLESCPFVLGNVLRGLKRAFTHKGRVRKLDLTIQPLSAHIPNALVGDAARLGEVFNDLLDNAVKFCPHEPAVVLTIDVRRQTDTGVTLEFAIQDNAIGIDSQFHAKIFEPFTQVDASTTRRFDGAGMGLAMCKRLVGLMGGDIWVHSQPGEGSTFYFTATFGLGNPEDILDWPVASKEAENKGGELPLLSATSGAPANLRPLLRDLEGALKEMNPEAVRRAMQALAPHVQGNERRVLEMHIDNYEYDQAMSLVQQLLSAPA